ncbi:hypothetical protein CORC01_10387 [Colletotrichum orchidophilum]|uniref:Uncharacterized protein n=1 Tax=Colletotrichum orchidophilum TaxID=1209926 RepID=A0A1G4AYU9_9PEZI|nr:uncharacterized protein CORC01_10387 [Colletotrichum orchidophilum]OHE94340.1 hypothetical protein CORC01_10387 [Colletotrichum orchidophilum]
MGGVSAKASFSEAQVACFKSTRLGYPRFERPVYGYGADDGNKRVGEFHNESTKDIESGTATQPRPI